MRIPRQWAEVTPSWMTAVLADRFPGAEVATVQPSWQTEGNNRRVRFGLTYTAGSGPGTVFVKAEGPFREVHAQNGNLFNEAFLARARLSLPLERPEPYAVLIDERGLDWLVVMEDVARRGADARDATRPMTPAQVTDGVRGLARMHRDYWGFSAQSVPALDWVQSWAASGDGFLSALRVRMAAGIALLGGSLPEPLAELGGDHLVDLCGRYLRAMAREPATLLHGDAHIGNTYVLPDDSVGFLDWQVVRRGNWSQDVGYFVHGALTARDQRRHERAILASYLRELGGGLDPDQAWTWFRASPLYGLPVWIATLGASGSQPVEIASALAHRYALAAVELDAIAALAEIEGGT